MSTSKNSNLFSDSKILEERVLSQERLCHVHYELLSKTQYIEFVPLKSPYPYYFDLDGRFTGICWFVDEQFNKDATKEPRLHGVKTLTLNIFKGAKCVEDCLSTFALNSEKAFGEFNHPDELILKAIQTGVVLHENDKEVFYFKN